jgi:hypothetical protein
VVATANAAPHFDVSEMKKHLNTAIILILLGFAGAFGFTLLKERNSAGELATALGFTVAETRLPKNEDKQKLLGIVIRNESDDVVFASGPQANSMSGRIVIYTRKIGDEVYETSVVGDDFSFLVDYKVPGELLISRPNDDLKQGEPFLIGYDEGTRSFSAAVEFFEKPILVSQTK